MDYFINPIWFYWMNVCGGLKNTAIAFAILFGISAVGFSPCYFYERTEYTCTKRDSDKTYMELWEKCAKWSIIVFVPLLLVALFCPDKQTLIEMQVASIATKTNAEWTADQLKGIADYIFERIKSLQ